MHDEPLQRTGYATRMAYESEGLPTLRPALGTGLDKRELHTSITCDSSCQALMGSLVSSPEY